MKVGGVAVRQLAVILLAGTALGAGIVLSPAVIALVAPGIVGVLVLVALVHGLIDWPDDRATERRVLQWTLVAFSSHLVFGVFVTGFPTPFDFLRSNSSTYHLGASALVQHWTHGGPTPMFPPGKEGFYYTLAALYWVFGAHTAAGLALNATLAAAVVPIVTNTTHRLFGLDAARRAPALLALLPSLFLWTAPLLKEAGVVFLVALACNCAVRLSDRISIGALGGLAISLSLLFTYRGPVALMASPGFVAAIALARRDALRAVVTGIAVGVALCAFVFGAGVGRTGYRGAVTQAELSEANRVRQDLANSANSGFDTDTDISTVRGAGSYFPIGLVQFALGPLPWQMRSASQLGALPDVLAWWYFLPALRRGYHRARASLGRRTLVLALPALFVTATFALISGNFGVVVRERVQVVILLVPLIALGIGEARSSAWLRAAGRTARRGDGGRPSDMDGVVESSVSRLPASRRNQVAGADLSILFLCTGNLCRSPAAEALLRHRLKELAIDATVHSAGFYREGLPTAAYTSIALRRRAIDSRRHHSRIVTAELLCDADVILGMAGEHVKWALELAPETAPRVFSLKEFIAAGEAVGGRLGGESVQEWVSRVHDGRALSDVESGSPELDVSDPMGRPLGAHEEMVEELQSATERLIALLWPDSAKVPVQANT